MTAPFTTEKSIVTVTYWRTGFEQLREGRRISLCSPSSLSGSSCKRGRERPAIVSQAPGLVLGISQEPTDGVMGRKGFVRKQGHSWKFFMFVSCSAHLKPLTCATCARDPENLYNTQQGQLQVQLPTSTRSSEFPV